MVIFTVKPFLGASKEIIDSLGSLVDRMSINIELPSHQSLKLLAPEKEKVDILNPMQHISTQIQQSKQEKSKHKTHFSPAGQTTQLIVGATPESDLKIIQLSESLYRTLKLKRVYYSAYVSINQDKNLPTLDAPPLLRENRLYQADWLMRFYGFQANELLDNTHPNFNNLLDPKCDWALRNLHQFPIEVNRADYFTLLRIPGIGVISAKRIVSARHTFDLGFEDLKRLGVVLKRARYFITCKRKILGSCSQFYSKFYYNEFNLSRAIYFPFSFTF